MPFQHSQSAVQSSTFCKGSFFYVIYIGDPSQVRISELLGKMKFVRCFCHFAIICHNLTILFFLNYFIYFIFGALGLCCCVWAFSSCGEWGLLFIVVRGLLIAVASLVAEHGLQAHGLQQLQHTGSVVVAQGPQSVRASVVVARELSSCGSQGLERKLSSCGTQAQLLCDMWDLPRPGFKPMSPASAGRFLTTAPRGKPDYSFLLEIQSVSEQISDYVDPSCPM